ncbi:unnamed protein product [Echinostoma caproni]|uniref:Fibronectin type-III domain-containing protein n=1 Tax=Echinostoma caproni TaxID=27848 RepID=A0A183AJW4_9TREM|nr:unnamed protein product [Echinostoma caproni]
MSWIRCCSSRPFGTVSDHTMQPFYNAKARIENETAYVTWNALQVDLMGSAHVHSTKTDWRFLHIPSKTQAVFHGAQACTLYQFRVAFLPSDIQDVPAFTCAFTPPGTVIA